MPRGLGSLSGLETLGLFVVGKPANSVTPYESKAKLACDLSDLDCLDNLKRRLTIILADRSKDIVSEAKASNLARKELKYLTMIFRESRLVDEMVLENLKLSADLTYLSIEKYGGMRLPSWMREGIHCWLPNLVDIKIDECKECINMCSFGRLSHLQSLYLNGLDKVEYIENGSSSKSDMVVLADEDPSTSLFPSLTHLHLSDIPRLKGWRSVTDSVEDRVQNQLLKWMPAFSKLEEASMEMELVISLAQGISSLKNLTVGEQRCGPSNVTIKQRQPVILLKNYLPWLRHLTVHNSQMEHLPEEFRGMSSLIILAIYGEALVAVPEWIDSFTSLEYLYIVNCPELKSLPHEIRNLSNLEYLYLDGCSTEIAERGQAPSGKDWLKFNIFPTLSLNPLKMGKKIRYVVVSCRVTLWSGNYVLWYFVVNILFNCIYLA
ncbi:putative disease resistance protein RGA1 [Silene latifolia]|uniref:putative disease resistance protein RGA1 n=1 Tax=Silene latifolia TaxID=37657 RepID=UPI003D78506C